MRVTPRTQTSYSASDPIALSIWLIEQGYTSADPRSQHEYLRLRKGASLVVVYHNGSVLLQGGDVDTPRALLQSIVSSQPALF